MGHRLSKIYTRTGDRGDTGLGDGSRVNKDGLRVEAFGGVDELNSHIGLLIAQVAVPSDMRATLTGVQHELFDLGGELCIPGHQVIDDACVARLEQALDALNNALPPLKEFVLPGGNMAAATAHVARAVCRRAERRVIALARVETVNAPVIAYLNRLSDLLFVMARVLARADGGEVLWRHER